MKRMMSVFALAVTIALPAAAWAQLVDLRLGANGPAFTYGRTSGRLAAIGGMVVAVPDETNELNAIDFGDNVTGLLSDRDAWSTDLWARKGDRTDRSNPVSRRTVDTDEQGLLFVSRLRDNTLALGLLLARAGGDLSGSAEDGRDLSGSNVSALYAQAFGERLKLGARAGVQEEKEGLSSTYVFALRHDASTAQGGVAAGYRALDWLQLGVTADYLSSTIDGASSSAFHRDQYTWERPGAQVSGTAIADFGDATAGLLIRRSSFDGREEVEANWADRFPLNPTHQNISWRGPTMKEEEDATVVLGRLNWEPDERTMVAALLGFGDEQRLVRRKANFDSSLPEMDEDEGSFAGALGASRWFREGRLLGAAEARMDQLSVDGKLARSTYSVDTSHLELSAGAEYFWTRSLLVRAGLLRSSRKHDTPVGELRHAGYGLTMGVGYVPTGGLLQIDAGYRFQRETPNDESKTLAEQGGLEVGKLEVQTITISARLLF